jgi:hypothetical protein
MAAGDLLTFPSGGGAGVSCSSPASTWTAGTYVDISASGLSTDIAIYGVTFESPAALLNSNDITFELLFEIATGGTPDVIIQVPFTIRRDTSAGYYQGTTQKILLPEPIVVTANTRIQVRVGDTRVLAITYDGIRIRYSELSSATAYTDSATASLSLIPSETDTAQSVDTNTIPLVLTPVGADVDLRVDSALTLLGISPTSSDIAAFIDSTVAKLTLTPATVELFAGIDQSLLLLNLQSSNIDALQALDSALVSMILTPTAVSEGLERVDSSTVAMSIIANSLDTAQYVDSSTMLLHLNPSGQDILDVIESSTVLMRLTAISSDIMQAFESQLIPLNLAPSATESAFFVDSGLLRLNLEISGVEQASGVSVDSALVLLKLQPISSELAQFIDASLTVLGLTPTSIDVPVYADSDVLPLNLVPDSFDFITHTDVGSLILQLQPSSKPELLDTSTVTLTLTVRGAEVAKIVALVATGFNQWFVDSSRIWEVSSYNKWMLLNAIRRYDSTAFKRWFKL